MEDLESHWQGRAKWLAQILIISVTLNAGLIATLCYFAVRDKKTFMAYELSPVQKSLPKASLTQSNEEVLSALTYAPYDDLIRMLGDSTLLEEGYTKRDLCLSCLIAFHHFDIHRALPGLDITPRCAIFKNDAGETITLEFFPNLNDRHYSAIKDFIRHERYPLTAQGLFERLTIAPGAKDLQKAFTRTFEYQALQSLFAQAGDPLSDEELFDFILAHDWNAIETSTELIRQNPHITLETKRSILIHLLKSGSKPAAELFAVQDLDYAIKRFSNENLQTLLVLLGPEHPTHSHITTAIENSLRPTVTEEIPAKAPTIRTHIIREGDTLWDIARLYRISLEDLQALNAIQSEYTLRPGQTLKIPN